MFGGQKTKNEEKDLSFRLKRVLNSGDVTAFKRLVKGGVDINAKYWPSKEFAHLVANFPSREDSGKQFRNTQESFLFVKLVEKSKYDSTLLHEAVSIGNPQIVEVLLQYKAKVNAKNKDGRTALHIATRAGKLDVVKQLLKAGAEINQQTVDGQTALDIAIWRAKFDIVETLLSSGADINLQDKDGWLPLHLATKLNYFTAVKQLVEHQAVIDSKISKSGQTPFGKALENNNLDLAEYLLLHGADVKTSVKGNSAAYVLMKNKSLTEDQIMDTMDFFIQNGFIMQNDDWLKLEKLPDRLTNHERFQQWLQSRRKTVQSLSSICRSSIRRHLSLCTCGKSIIHRIELLPLPHILMDYVRFTERFQNSLNKLLMQPS